MANRHSEHAHLWPIVRTYGGDDVRVTEGELDQIEQLISQGRSLEVVAIALGLCERDFKQACKVNERLLQSIKRGRALDRQEYMDDLRAIHKSGKSPIISVWYGKQHFGMHDKSTVSHQGGNVVVVNTGVPRVSQPQSSANVIEHDDT